MGELATIHPERVAAENHRKFLRRLAGSEPAVFLAAWWLWHRGHAVMLLPTSYAPTRAEWKEHADGGDLFIRVKQKGDWRRIEVKHLLAKSFTCAEDFRFPDVMVCARHSLDNANPKPFAYLLFNAALTHVAVVLPSTCERWRIDKAADRHYQNVEQEFYFAPLDCVQFFRVD